MLEKLVDVGVGGLRWSVGGEGRGGLDKGDFICQSHLDSSQLL